MGDILLSEGVNELNVQLTPIAQVASLYGVVTDAETGQPIDGVKVTLDSFVTYTNASGAYAFEGLNPGSYVIRFEKENYQTVEM